MIRQMTKTDIPQVVAIEELCFSMPWSAQGFFDTLERPDTLFLVYTEDAQICGYVGLYQSFEEGEITNVAVDPAKRRCGIARQLLQALDAQAKARGIAKIFLEVRVSNQPAIALYEKQGYERIAMRPGFYSRPREDALVMRKQ